MLNANPLGEQHDHHFQCLTLRHAKQNKTKPNETKHVATNYLTPFCKQNRAHVLFNNNKNKNNKDHIPFEQYLSPEVIC